METIDAVVHIISTVGFPIAACCGLFWYANKEREDHKKETQELTSTIVDLKGVIQQNTATIELLAAKIS